MTHPLTQVLPYTTPFLNLVGASFGVAELKPGSKLLVHRLIAAISDFVSLLGIVYLSVKAAREDKMEKAVLYGAVTILIAVIIPRFALEPSLERHCKGCTSAGKFGVGFVLLAGLCLANYYLA